MQAESTTVRLECVGESLVGVTWTSRGPTLCSLTHEAATSPHVRCESAMSRCHACMVGCLSGYRVSRFRAKGAGAM